MIHTTIQKFDVAKYFFKGLVHPKMKIRIKLYACFNMYNVF